MNKDCLHKYLVCNNEALVTTVYCKDVVNAYIDNVKSSPLASVAIGRLLCAGLMMGATLKGNENLLVSINGKGPLGDLKVKADSLGNVAGFVSNPLVNLPLNEYGQLDVAKGVGNNGFITVRKQLNMKEPFIGTCELFSGEIGEDISYYYGTSEQIPTVCALGITIDVDYSCKVAGGFMIQLLPFASEETICKVEALLTKIKSVSKMLEESNEDSSKIVKMLFDDDKEILTQNVNYKCSCSKEKTLLLLQGLTKDELQEEIEKGQSEVTCNFCLKKYIISKEELQEIIRNKES